MSSPRFTRSRGMSFFAELKARSHSQDVAGQDSVSNAYWWILGYIFCIASHHETRLKLPIAGVTCPYSSESPQYCVNSSLTSCFLERARPGFIVYQFLLRLIFAGKMRILLLPDISSASLHNQNPALIPFLRSFASVTAIYPSLQRTLL